MDIFYSMKPGLVGVAHMPGGTAGMLSVSGPGGDLTGMGPVIVTSFNISLAVNNQYSPALNRSVYVYGFGDRIGTLTVSGLTFNAMCDDSNGQGLAKVLAFYGGGRAIRDVTMSLSVGGGGAFRGYLDRCEVGSDNPELHFGRFTLQAATLPSMMGI